MDYQLLIQRVQRLDFINEDAIADAAIKAVLGIIVSSLDGGTVSKLVKHLPRPLTLETLRSHQATPTTVTFEQCAAELAGQFKVDINRARDLVSLVITNIKELIKPEDLKEIRSALPEDWQPVFQ